MNKFILLATISTAIAALFLAETVTAQSILGQDYSSITIYTPSTETTTNITTEQTNLNISSDYNSGNTSTITIYSNNGFPSHNHQPTIILQQENIYPRPVQSSCSTSIIGSPIPSPIALNRSGQPCH